MSTFVLPEWRTARVKKSASSFILYLGIANLWWKMRRNATFGLISLCAFLVWLRCKTFIYY